MVHSAAINANAGTPAAAAQWLRATFGRPNAVLRQANIGGNRVTSVKLLVRAVGWPLFIPQARMGFWGYLYAEARFHGMPIAPGNTLWCSCTLTNLRRPVVANGVAGFRVGPGQLFVNRRYVPPAIMINQWFDDFRTAIWRFTVSVPLFDVEDPTFKFTNILAGGALNVRIKQGVGSKSVIPVREFNDHLCAVRALILLMTHRKRKESKEHKALWRLIRNTVGKNEDSKACTTLQRLTFDFANSAAIDPDRPLNFADLNRLQVALSFTMEQESHIQVFSADLQMNLVYSTYPDGVVGDNFDDVQWYDLILANGHYYPALKIHRVLNNQRKFCYKCKKTYQNTHVCVTFCTMCKGDVDHFKEWVTEKDGSKWKSCPDCSRNFYSEACFNLHKQNGTCDKFWKCLHCNKCFRRHDPEKSSTANMCNPDEHRCGDFFCFNCKSWENKEHQCYMTVLDGKEENNKFLFCDFEATQETGKHVVNLAVTQTQDGTMWPIFSSMPEWLDYLLSGEWWGYTVIFHNGKGYDFHFILKDVLQRRGFRYSVDPVLVGAKILYFTLTPKRRFKQSTGLRFVDSLNFLPMALKKFTKTFGLQTKKGFYPHFFNTASNLDYTGPLPSESAFGAESMDDKSYAVFKEWYEERKLEPWDNRKELVDYCVADVTLLREGCMSFRRLVMESTTLRHDPFQNITLASSAMTLFRSEMLAPNTVGAFPAQLARELKPALAGGRTGATKLFYACQPDEKLFYVDFTSAYPYVCKNGVYPKGHPEIWEPGSQTPRPSLEDGASIWKVDIKCPDIYHPLLHHKDPDTGLLLFDLRDKVATMYTNFELVEAVRLGYIITKVHKIYYWRETIVGVFKEYINIFLKMKQQAAGWPRDDMSEEEKQEYLDDYKQNEGIDLDPNCIEKNPGKYHVAKLYLNSLWGKFGQRLGEHFSRTMIIHNTEAGIRKFNKAVAGDDVKDALIVSDHSLVLTLDGKEVPSHIRQGGTNIALAIFTTAWARLKLYKELLEPLGRRICYYDTDSAIFMCKRSEMEWVKEAVPLGRYLGDITNELGNNKYTYDGVYIKEFVSGGPKNYGYITTNDEKVSKIKGHQLKKRNVASHLNFDAIKSAVLYSSEFIVENPMITREDGFELVNTQGHKAYRFDFTKRRVPYPRGSYLDDGTLHFIDTVPWDNDNPPPVVPAPSLRTVHTILEPISIPRAEYPPIIGQKRGRSTVSVVANGTEPLSVHIGDSFEVRPELFVTGFLNFAEASDYIQSTRAFHSTHSNLSPNTANLLSAVYPIMSARWVTRSKAFIVCTKRIDLRTAIFHYVSSHSRVVFTQ